MLAFPVNLILTSAEFLSNALYLLLLKTIQTPLTFILSELENMGSKIVSIGNKENKDKQGLAKKEIWKNRD